MPNVLIHSATALPFLVIGDYANAIGCVAPDIVWIPNEISIRRSRKAVQKVIDEFPEWRILPYRITHSALLWCLMGPSEALLGALIHIALDCFTHKRRMRQQPLFPIPWRWPCTL